MWKRMLDLDVQLFAWLGDIVYADTTDMRKMRALYDRQLAHPEYQKLLAQVPVVGIWDDHDYGHDDAGREYPKRSESQKLLLDFLGESPDSKRRAQQGVYTSYDFSSESSSVRLILLDGRFHRDSPKTPGADILGADQWKWLEHQLTSSRARANLILTGYSVLSPRIPGAEQWVNFPDAHRKLFEVIERSGAKGVLFLTGDRHFAGMMTGNSPSKRTYYELLASGLNKRLELDWARKGLEIVYGSANSVFEYNFGLVEIDWNQFQPELVFTAQGETGPLRLRKVFSLRRGEWVLVR